MLHFRAALVVLAGIACACNAVTGIEDYRTVPVGGGDAGPTLDAQDADAQKASKADAADEADSGTERCPLPAGSIVTTSPTDKGSASLVADGRVDTFWSGNDSVGWVRIKFPKKIQIDHVHIAALASPSSEETYTIKAWDGTAPRTIGVAVRTVVRDELPGEWLAPIGANPGLYDDVTIEVTESKSWIAIAEIAISCEPIVP